MKKSFTVGSLLDPAMARQFLQKPQELSTLAQSLDINPINWLPLIHFCSKRVSQKMKRPLDAAEIPGLILRADIITPEEETTLLAAVDASEWDTRLSRLSRRTQHYGYRYDYRSREASEPVGPLPEWCLFVAQRLVDEGLLHEMLGTRQARALRRTDSDVFGDGIASVSLGCAATMEFSQWKGAAKKLPLPRYSALVLHQEARYKWRHALPPNQSADRRVSLTFRRMKKKQKCSNGWLR